MVSHFKICYIYQDQYPWDVRAEKITTTLAAEGFDTHIISRNRDGLPKREKLLPNLYVHRLPIGFNAPSRDFLNFPAFLSPIWIGKIVNVVCKYNLDIIIVRDLPLSPAAYVAGKITNKPVVMDMAENYPALIRSTWTYRGPKPIDYIIRNPILLKWMEDIIIPLLDGILVVSSHSAKRIEKRHKDKKRIWIVSNTPVIQNNNQQADKGSLRSSLRQKSSFILLYVGFIEAHRGLEIPIRAISQLAKEMPDVLLIIVGKGSYENRLKYLAKDLGVEKNVNFTGWKPHEQIHSFIRTADVCLIPHYVTEHTETTFPNKIFEYMAAKKPVIVTQSRALSDIVKSSKCGFVYYDKSPDSLCNALSKLFDARTRESMGLNGLKAVQKEFNWNEDSKRLLVAIKELSKIKG